MYTVMIAEDEEIYRRALTVFVEWEKLDCRIIYTAINGTQVLENIESIAPDILITDIRMPGADGIELLSYIKKMGLHTVPIVLTAYADFSYAQAAFRNQAVDYVVKSGAFEELVEAIEKAKIVVEEQREKKKEEGKEETKQGIYKAVFDGSIFLHEDREKRLASIQMKKKYGLLLLYVFQNRKEESDSSRRRNHSLQNFFGMVYGEMLKCVIPMNEERMILVLETEQVLSRAWLQEKSVQATGMMDNFMDFYTCVTVSNPFETMEGLREAYREVTAVLDNSFLEDLSQMTFYADIRTAENNYRTGLDQNSREICQSVRLGRREETLTQFGRLLMEQKKARLSASAIKGTGILLKNECGAMLKEFNETLYDVTDLNPSITKKITNCISYAKYAALMTELLGKTADFFNQVVDKKEYLVKRCREYLEQHYREDISVADLARSLGTSSSYLSRIYKEGTGSTIIYDLNRKRVEMAEYYLKEKQMKIYEVAELTGFRDVTYFSHTFKTYTGISPKQFQSKR